MMRDAKRRRELDAQLLLGLADGALEPRPSDPRQRIRAHALASPRRAGDLSTHVARERRALRAVIPSHAWRRGAAHRGTGFVAKADAASRGDRTSTRTAASPPRFISSATAASEETSMTRRVSRGPRSLMRSTADRPLSILVTRTI